MSAIAIYEKMENPLAAIDSIGSWIAKSGMFGCQNEEQGRIVAMTCMEERITPLEYLRRYHTIMGRPAMRTDYMLAKFDATPNCGHKDSVSTPDEASATFIVDGKEHKVALRWADIQREPFVYEKDGKTYKDNYATPWMRSRMLWSRLVSSTIRMLKPEIVAGIYTPEEVSDFLGQPAASSTAIKLDRDSLGTPVAPADTVIAGEFRVVQDPPAEEQVAVVFEVQKTPEPAPVVAPATEPETKAEGYKQDLAAIEKQLEGANVSVGALHAEIYQLFDECGLDQEARSKSLTKRFVTRVEDLNVVESEKLINALRQWAARKKSDQAS